MSPTVNGDTSIAREIGRPSSQMIGMPAERTGNQPWQRIKVGFRVAHRQ